MESYDSARPSPPSPLEVPPVQLSRGLTRHEKFELGMEHYGALTKRKVGGVRAKEVYKSAQQLLSIGLKC